MDTHIGLIILYTAFNLSFSVWLMKGFIDEIPIEYEEAALVDGYTRMQAFFKIVLPQAATGIAATAVFCFITAWNEYAFALMMTNRKAQTAPPYIPAQLGSGMTDWTVIAAGTFLFLLPVAIVHLPVAQALAARRDVRSDPEMTGEPPAAGRTRAAMSFRHMSARYLEPIVHVHHDLRHRGLCQPWSQWLHVLRRGDHDRRARRVLRCSPRSPLPEED